MTSSGSSPDSGRRIGAYEIQRLLGRGGMGEVFLAWDSRLRRQVAIKRIRTDRGIDAVSRQRLLREARAAAGLSHPAIVHVYDLIEDAETGDCIVMEYVEGRTLAAELSGGTLEPARAVRLGHEIAEGLAAAHAAGIVHRDLKAENVIVTLSGHAKILDFGLARLTMDDVQLTQDGALLGTFHMMSPEQANGGDTDERSDLFSLGLVLYEMLTGISPFRGATPQETLKRVLSERPLRVDAVRPGLPARLGDLVESLLAKEPGARPGSSAEVVRELGEIAALLSSSFIPTRSASVSDLSTVVEMPDRIVSQPLTRQAEASGSTAGMSVLRRRGVKRAALAVLAMVVLVALGILAWGAFPTRRRPAPQVTVPAVAPLRVLVWQPKVDSKDERLVLAASGLLSASLNTLASLEGVVAIDPLQLEGSPPSSAVEMARVTGTDEVLLTTLERSGALARVTLRRVSGRDGQSLWTTPEFDVSIEPQDLRLLSDVVGGKLRQAYPAHLPRKGTLQLEALDKDYATFLEIKQRVDSGRFPYEPELALLDPILESSPRFLEAWLLAARLRGTLSVSTRQVAYLDKGFKLVKRAEALAPGDPRPLYTRFRLEVDGGKTESAERTLKDIERRFPENPELYQLRAHLEEQDGRLDDALRDRHHAVNLVPSWRNLYYLASLEARVDKLDEARAHLDEILSASPGNLWALEKQAEIELLFGDLKRAETIYQKMIRQAPTPIYYANLGAARVLMGKYEKAIGSFRQALAMSPNNYPASLGLADAELALGRTADARQNYEQALRQLENSPESPPVKMAKAQCLAYLDKRDEALKAAEQALQQMPDNADMLQQAAQVFAAAGDRDRAVDSVKKALEKGIQTRWFKLPSFKSLRSDSEFHRLVYDEPRATPSQ